MERGNGGNSEPGVHGVKVWSMNASKDVKVWPLAAHADMLRVLA